MAISEDTGLAAKPNTRRSPGAKKRPVENSERAARAKKGERCVEPVPYVPSKVFPVRVITGATQAEQAQQVARDLTAPDAAATRIIVTAEGKSAAGEWLDVAGTLSELRRVASDVIAGDLSHAEAMLVNQAQALQTLATRLIERGFGQEMFCHFEAFLRLGLRAQSQSRQTLEALALLKQGPAVFARQANVAAGAPMQVNNVLSAAAAREIEIPPNQLLEASDDCMDSRAQSGASAGDPPLETMGAKHRAKNVRR